MQQDTPFKTSLISSRNSQRTTQPNITLPDPHRKHHSHHQENANEGHNQITAVVALPDPHNKGAQETKMVLQALQGMTTLSLFSRPL